MGNEKVVGIVPLISRGSMVMSKMVYYIRIPSGVYCTVLL
jgi:hypothetical protein